MPKVSPVSSETYRSVSFPTNEKILSVFNEEQREKIRSNLSKLKGYGWLVSSTSDVSIDLNTPNGGWYFDFLNNVIRIDPIDLLKKDIQELIFIIAHEGSHKKISRLPDKELRPETEDVSIQNLYLTLLNVNEDGRVNNFIFDTFPLTRPGMEMSYNSQYQDRDLFFIKLRKDPKFRQLYFLMLYTWYCERHNITCEIPSDLDPEVLNAYNKVINSAASLWWIYPTFAQSNNPKHIEVYSNEFNSVTLTEIWPEVEKLIEADKKKAEDELIDQLDQDKPESETEEEKKKRRERAKERLTEEERKKIEEEIKKIIDDFIKKIIEDLDKTKKRKPKDPDVPGPEDEPETPPEEPEGPNPPPEEPEDPEGPDPEEPLPPPGGPTPPPGGPTPPGEPKTPEGPEPDGPTPPPGGPIPPEGPEPDGPPTPPRGPEPDGPTPPGEPKPGEPKPGEPKPPEGPEPDGPTPPPGGPIPPEGPEPDGPPTPPRGPEPRKKPEGPEPDGPTPPGEPKPGEPKPPEGPEPDGPPTPPKGPEPRKKPEGPEPDGPTPPGEPKPPEGPEPEKPQPQVPDIEDILKRIREAQRESKIPKIQSRYPSLDRNFYEQERKKIYSEINDLEDSLRDIFIKRRSSRFIPGYKSGKKISIEKRLKEKAKGIKAAESRAWERKLEAKESDYAITILVDLSASMGGKINSAIKALVMLAESLSRIGIKFEILGFHERILILKEFGSEFNDDIRDRFRDFKIQVRSNEAGWNNDGYAVSRAAERLMKTKEEQRVLIVISDGEPFESPEFASYDLPTEIQKITENTNITLIGVGIGEGTEHVDTYYPNSVSNVSISDFPRSFKEILIETIDSN